MRITHTEPSSVILSQTNFITKLKSDVPIVPSQANAKGWCTDPQYYNLNQFQKLK